MSQSNSGRCASTGCGASGNNNACWAERTPSREEPRSSSKGAQTPPDQATIVAVAAAAAKKTGPKQQSRKTKRKRSHGQTGLSKEEEKKLVERFRDIGRRASTGGLEVTFTPRPSQDGRLKRPANAFFVFAQYARGEFEHLVKNMHSCAVNVMLGQAWRFMAKSERRAFCNEASRLSTEYAKQKNQQEKKKNPRQKRPLNAFMLYCKDQRATLEAPKPGKGAKSQRAVVTIIGRRWNRLSRQEKQKYFDKAKKLIQGYCEDKQGTTSANPKEVSKQPKPNETPQEETKPSGDSLVPDNRSSSLMEANLLDDVFDNVIVKTPACAYIDSIIPAKKPRLGKNCNNTLQIDSDTDGERGRLKVTFRNETDNAVISDPASSSSSADSRVVHTVTRTSHTSSDRGIPSSSAKETAHSDSSSGKMSTSRRLRCLKRKKRYMWRPKLKKRVRWNTTDDTIRVETQTSCSTCNIEDDLLVDGFSNKEKVDFFTDCPCCFNCNPLQPYATSRAPGSQLECLIEIDNVFADADAYFTADSDSSTSSCEYMCTSCLEPETSSTCSDDDCLSLFNTSALNLSPRTQRICYMNPNSTVKFSDVCTSNKNQHRTSTDLSGINSNNEDCTARAEKQGPRISSPTSVRSQEKPAVISQQDSADASGHQQKTKRHRHCSHHLMRTAFNTSGAKFTEKLKRVNARSASDPDTHTTNVHLCTDASIPAGHGKNICDQAHGSTQWDSCQGNSTNYAKENEIAQEKQVLGNERDCHEQIGRHDGNVTIGYEGEKTHLANSAVGQNHTCREKGSPLESRTQRLECRNSKLASFLQTLSSTSDFKSSRRAKNKNPQTNVVYNELPCHPVDLQGDTQGGCKDTSGQMPSCPDDLLDDNEILDLAVSSFSDSSLDQLLLESLGEYAPVSSNMYSLWNGAAFSKDLPHGTEKLPDLYTHSGTCLSSVGSPRSSSLDHCACNDCGETKFKHRQNHIFQRKGHDLACSSFEDTSRRSFYCLRTPDCKTPSRAFRANSWGSFGKVSDLLRRAGDNNAAAEKDVYGITSLTKSFDSLVLADKESFYANYVTPRM